MVSISKVMSEFNEDLKKFDKNKDGVMQSGELGSYGAALRESGFFSEFGLNESAFMLELHHYDNRTISDLKKNLKKGLADEKNYMGNSVFA